MNRNLIFKTLGLVLSCEAAAMVPSLLLSFYYDEGDFKAFIYSITITGPVGLALSLIPVHSKVVGYREGFTIATLSWLLTAGFGSLPFIYSGALGSFVDAFFETMSGFTTTGASVITDVEALPHGILFWRSLTHWLGGMG
ncbi:MAG: TrkH family potassium uptake protein, partial [Peptococcaceae bacterium]|nr:TrkH family potassium uptake protein [Peptococcaceae bacterium]